MQNNKELIRLNKYIASCGFCSRRKADEFISKALVKVNGKVIKDLGFKVNSNDAITINGVVLNKQEKTYILLNKPKDTVTTTKDTHNRRTVIDLIKLKSDVRIFPVGRLDRNTTGVLLLTNDGDLAYKLTHPSKNIHKVYLAHLDKAITKNDVISLLTGVEIDESVEKFDSVEIQENSNSTKVFVSLHSGKYHIVKRMFESLSYKVKSLDRTSFAGIQKSKLKRGEWRFLKDAELSRLFSQ
jgi:23S rRNA pseudouridine2605 synthase